MGSSSQAGSAGGVDALGGDRFARDADGNFRLVYSGDDAQARNNVNCVVLEIPLGY